MSILKFLLTRWRNIFRTLTMKVYLKFDEYCFWNCAHWVTTPVDIAYSMMQELQLVLPFVWPRVGESISIKEILTMNQKSSHKITPFHNDSYIYHSNFPFQTIPTWKPGKMQMPHIISSAYLPSISKIFLVQMYRNFKYN